MRQATSSPAEDGRSGILSEDSSHPSPDFFRRPVSTMVRMISSRWKGFPPERDARRLPRAGGSSAVRSICLATSTQSAVPRGSMSILRTHAQSVRNSGRTACSRVVSTNMTGWPESVFSTAWQRISSDASSIQWRSSRMITSPPGALARARIMFRTAMPNSSFCSLRPALAAGTPRISASSAGNDIWSACEASGPEKEARRPRTLVREPGAGSDSLPEEAIEESSADQAESGPGMPPASEEMITGGSGPESSRLVSSSTSLVLPEPIPPTISATRWRECPLGLRMPETIASRLAHNSRSSCLLRPTKGDQSRPASLSSLASRSGPSPVSSQPFPDCSNSHRAPSDSLMAPSQITEPARPSSASSFGAAAPSSEDVTVMTGSPCSPRPGSADRISSESLSSLAAAATAATEWLFVPAAP